ncbi:MAG: HAD-IB family phosphatase [Solirubrobacterales bacterium]
MGKLHIFDMDGTLLSGSACLELSRFLGKIEAVEEMEERWGRGELGHVEFYEHLLPLWEGLEEVHTEEVFEGIEWLEGIEEVWQDIAARGERSAVITLSPQFFGDLLTPWGVHHVFGAEVFAGAPPDPELVLTPESKVYIAVELLERYGLGDADCVAYGDSSSDIPLFEFLTNTVAVNASPRLVEVAAASYAGNDLRQAYALGRSLLSPASSRR